MIMPSEEDYKIAFCNPPLIKCPLLAGGSVYKDKVTENPHMWTGGFCVVFKYALANGRVCAVRCWKTDIDNSMQRAKMVAETINKLTLPYFVNFEYYEKAIAACSEKHPIVVMDWVEGETLKKYVEVKLNNASALAALAGNFRKMVSDLHANNLSHGDLQHANIIVKDNGDIKLIDYDSMYVPGMESFPDTIKGLEGYQHPGRKKLNRLSPKSDYFSELIIYTGLLWLSKDPSIFSSLQMADTEYFILSTEDIINPDHSSVLLSLCNNPDGELAALGYAIRQELNKEGIYELRPLETILNDIKSFKRPISHKPLLKFPNGMKLPKIRLGHIVIAACIAGLCTLGYCQLSRYSGADEKERPRVNALGMDDPRLPGIYSFKNSSGEIFPAEISRSENGNHMTITVYSKHKPKKYDLAFDDNLKIYSDNLGVGTASVDSKANAIVLSFDNNGVNTFTLYRYL